MPALADPAVDTRLHVLVVEDHVPLLEELVDHLQGIGHQVVGLNSPLDVDRLLMREPIDLLVLDLNLPFEDGLSVARRVRSALPDIGIIAMSGRIRSEQKTAAYADGVDIFLAKPASPDELAAAIQSLARRLRSLGVNETWLLDVRQNLLTSPQGHSLTLTGGETLLLRTMALAPDRTLDSAEIDRLDIGSKRGLESAISRLRLKLTPLADGAPCIKVVWGRGYQLLLKVAIAPH